MAPRRWLRPRISQEEYQILQSLRERKPARHPPETQQNKGERIADVVAIKVGSWQFITILSVVVILWIFLNIIPGLFNWDSYPFLLLNLMLSFQAAYIAAMIMMSHNRQLDINRQRADYNYQVNLKTELEIELLHDKINMLREAEIVELTQMVREQQQQLQRLEELLVQRLDTSPKDDNTTD